jgi:hypothetical protein
MLRQRDKGKTRVYSKRHYEANRDRMIARAKADKPRAKAAAHKIISDYLADHPCVDCGEADPVVLEFDHRSAKLFDIGSAIGRGYGARSIAAEVAKCDVRCANCHRRKTYAERGFSHRG